MPRKGERLPKELAGKFHAGGLRARERKKLKAFSIASGRNVQRGMYEDYRPARAHLDVSPAVWRSAHADIGEHEYVDYGLDEIELRALNNRVLYAQRVCCHRDFPFREVSERILSAAVRVGSGKPAARRGKKELSLKEMQAVFTKRQLAVIEMIASGLTTDAIAVRLGVAPRTAKMHCDVLRKKLEVNHRREIPGAYRELTGEDPFSLGARVAEATRSRPTPAIVEEARTTGYREGQSLGDVLAQMFDSDIN